MAEKFLSFLGTNKYVSCTYYHDDKERRNVRYVQGNYSGSVSKMSGLGSLLVQGAQHPSFDPVYESEAKFAAIYCNFMVGT